MKKKPEEKIFIIGSNSFLARNFHYYLTKMIGIKEKKVFCYDITKKSKEQVINYTQIDFLNKESLNSINFSEVKSIYFFTGLTGTVKSFENYEQYISINEVALLNFISAYIEHNCQAKIIYPSTRLIYQGDTGEKLKEDSNTKFKSIYAVNKFAAEKYLEVYSNVFGLKYCVLRICAPYGTLLSDNGNYGTYEFFVNQAKRDSLITVYGDGNITKTYTHISDICELMWLVSNTPQCDNQVFNVGGDIKSLSEIAQMVADKYNAKVKNVEWPKVDKQVDAGSTVLDSTKLDSIFNYKYIKLKDNL